MRSHKEELKALISELRAKGASPKQLHEGLADAGAEVYERAGTVTGVRYQGRKYRFKTLGLEKQELFRLDDLTEGITRQVGRSIER